MNRFVPLEAFEHDGQAVVAVDGDGSVQLCNHAARQLLGLSTTSRTDSKCWQFAAFRTIDGKPFCRQDCPVQKAAKEGRAGAQHWAVPTRGPHADQPIEIVSFFVPWEDRRRSAVLHFLRPASLAAADATSSALAAASLHISTREADVLRLLSEGRSTTEIADALGIAPNTVRNHFRSIFLKLGVHRRVEAVVAFSRTVARVADRAPH